MASKQQQINQTAKDLANAIGSMKGQLPILHQSLSALTKHMTPEENKQYDKFKEGSSEVKNMEEALKNFKFDL